MSLWKSLVFSALVIALASSVSVAPAQISVGIGVGGYGYPYAAPACSYGYYDYAPYACAPYGYYGPEWFNGGLFIGAGPWFHGPRGFHGSVDRHFDPRNGYHGSFPQHGGYHAPPDNFQNFHANEARDGQGHVGVAAHEGGGEHAGGYAGSRGGSRAGGHPR